MSKSLVFMSTCVIVLIMYNYVSKEAYILLRYMHCTYAVRTKQFELQKINQRADNEADSTGHVWL